MNKQQVRCLLGLHNWLYSDHVQNSIYDIGTEARCAACGTRDRRPSAEVIKAYRERGEMAFFPECRKPLPDRPVKG